MKHSIAGHLRGRSDSIKSRSSSEEQRDPVEDDTTVVEPDQNNVLSHIISQLRPGADLSRITLPTFILEERSMLERITNFMAHPETLLPMPDIDDPLQRFISVVKFYLSGWHIKPPGVKKPLNPILGETFTCYWDYPDKTRGYYISEQTSHHPPKSSYFFVAPEHHIRVDGTLKPRSKFLGNSAASLMEGISYLRFTNRGSSKGGEKYIVTQPNMYARGILFGKMKYELGDHSYIRCPENNLTADVEFKVKGWVGGTYNAIGGFIKNEKTGENLYELSGLWSGEMFIKDLKSGQKRPLFDATHAKHTLPLTRPISEQDERESQRLWQKVCKAVHISDHHVATDEKAKIEDRQRQEAHQREESGQEWHPKLFRPVRAGPGGSEEGEADLEYILNTDLDPKADPKSTIEKVLSIAAILPGQKTISPPGSQTQQQPRQSLNPHPNASANLIDMESRPSNTVPPTATSQVSTFKQTPVHNASIVGNPPRTSNLIDDGGDANLSGKLSDLHMHEPLTPTKSMTALKRADTETSDVDVFVDAEG